MTLSATDIKTLAEFVGLERIGMVLNHAEKHDPVTGIYKELFDPDSDLNHTALLEAEIGRRGEEWQRVYGSKLGDMIFKKTGIVQPTLYTMATAPPSARSRAVLLTIEHFRRERG